MSVNKNQSTEETVYNLERPKSEIFNRPAMYFSKFRPQVREAMSAMKLPHRTMGFSSINLPGPQEFLRKNQGIRYIQPAEHRKCFLSQKLPPVPNFENFMHRTFQSDGNQNQRSVFHHPAMNFQGIMIQEEEINDQNVRTAAGYAMKYHENSPIQQRNNEKLYNSDHQKYEKDFKWKNIQKVMQGNSSQQAEPKYVDTKNGDTQKLLTSGLIPIYIYSPKFGKVPKYLQKRIEDIKRKKETSSVADLTIHEGIKYVKQEERQEILNGLKKNWEDLQNAYQRLPILTDTLQKKARKTRLEKELKQLEQDILLVERNSHIYVCDTRSEIENKKQF